MKILEVRDGFIKFEADKEVYLSSFIRVESMYKSYIGQVIQLRKAVNVSIAVAKLIYLFDGNLIEYDKTLPSRDSNVIPFPFESFNELFGAKNKIIAGKTPVTADNIVIDESAFDKKLIISVDNQEYSNILIKNLVKQFNSLGKNVVIIDTLGTIKARKYCAATDFKLPMNTSSLAFLYQDCLNDATSDSKSTIINLFSDLAEYSKSVPFLPFRSLKNIVDEMVDKSHIFKLLVLKNKLIKFEKQGYFATTDTEVERLKKILDSKCSVIDLSKLDTAFLNRYLSYILQTLQNSNNTQVLLSVSNSLSKKNLKAALLSEKISSTIITHSKFKYLNDIKPMFDNFILFPSDWNGKIFDSYKPILQGMDSKTYLISGKATKDISLVSQICEINDVLNEPSLNQAKSSDIPAAEIDNANSEDAELIDFIEQQTENAAVVENNVNDKNVIIEDSKGEKEKEEKKNTHVIDYLAENTDNQINTKVQDSKQEQPKAEDISDEIQEEDDSEFEELEFAQITESEDYEEQNENTDYESEFFESVDNAEEEYDDEYDDDRSLADILDNSADEDDITEEDDNLLQSLEDENNTAEISEEDLSDGDEDNDAGDVPIGDITSETEDYSETEVIQEDSLTENESDDNESIDVDDIDLDLDDIEQPEQDSIVPENENNQNLQHTPVDVIPISSKDEDLAEDGFDEIMELDSSDTAQDDILVDITDDNTLPDIPETDIDAQIVKDVDKVFTTRRDDDISDSDLDFIDTLNADAMPVEEVFSSDEDDGIIDNMADEGIIEEYAPTDTTDTEILETKHSSTPIVPMYDADIPHEDMVISDPIQQGDTVLHAKYGTGIVEKMIKYGNKTLFSINFDNIGRRLLDPTITEIKKS